MSEANDDSIDWSDQPSVWGGEKPEEKETDQEGELEQEPSTGDEESEVEDTETEANEDTQEADDDVEEDEEVDTTDYQEVSENLKKAMQSEREKRKDATRQLNDAKTQQQFSDNRADLAEERLSKVVEQIRELGLEETITVPEEQKLDPRVEALLQQQQSQAQAQQQQQFLGEMQQAVSSKVGDYSNIDTKVEAQGSILARMILADVGTGRHDSVDAAADAALKELNTLLDTTVSTYKKKRQPAVKPKRKVRSATKARVNKEPQTIKGIFDQLGKDMANRGAST